MALAHGVVKKTTGYNAAPDQIVRRDGFNPRFDFGDLEEIKTSIKQNGFHRHKPLLVRRREDSKFELIDGDRRFTAVEELLKEGHVFEEGIPVVIEDRNITEADALILMFTANTGKAFLPLEEAAAYRRMIDQGLTISEIHKRIGKSDVHVRDRLSLLDAAPEVREALAEGAIGATMAEQIAIKNKGDFEKQKQMVDEAKDGKDGKARVRIMLTQPKNSVARKELEILESEVTKLVDGVADSLGVSTDFAALKAFCSADDELVLAYYAGAKMMLARLQGNAEGIEI